MRWLREEAARLGGTLDDSSLTVNVRWGEYALSDTRAL